MKLSEAIERVNKLTEDCNDLKEALMLLESYRIGENAKETMEMFIHRCSTSTRIPIELLLSTLVQLEEDLRILLDTEIIVQEVPGE